MMYEEGGLVEGFRGKYAFLSNFYPSPMTFEGITYPTAEHAYQAQKAEHLCTKIKIASLPYPGAAKRYGAQLPLPADWDQRRYQIMNDIIMIKFQDPVLRQKLLDTGNASLIETNNWGDDFWGVCNNVGSNNLGRSLMIVRMRMGPDNEIIQF